MATPAYKEYLLEVFLDTESLRIYGISRTDAIKKDICLCCKNPAVEFKDDISQREYLISGYCQTCQDTTFEYGFIDDAS